MKVFYTIGASPIEIPYLTHARIVQSSWNMQDHALQDLCFVFSPIFQMFLIHKSCRVDINKLLCVKSVKSVSYHSRLVFRLLL